MELDMTESFEQDLAADQEAREAAQREALAELRERLSMREQETQERLQALAREGVQPGAAWTALVRVHTLAEVLLGPLDGPEQSTQRVKYELAVQDRLDADMGQMEEQVRKVKLTHGTAGGLPPQLRNGGRAQGGGLILPG